MQTPERWARLWHVVLAILGAYVKASIRAKAGNIRLPGQITVRWIASDLRQLLIAVTLAASSHACAQATPERPTFPVTDSQFPAQEGRSGTFWLDNDRVLFTGVDLAATVATNRITIATYIWDSKSRTVSKYREGHILQPCMDGDEIAFFTFTFGATPIRRVHVRGRPGAEVETIVPNGTQLNDFDCTLIDGERGPMRLGEKKNRRVIQAHRDDGYFDLGPFDRFFLRKNSEDFQYRLIKPSGDSVLIELDPTVVATPVAYHPPSKQYIFVELQWEHGLNRAWLVSKSGRVEQMKLPSDGWERPVHIFLTKRGIALHVTSTTTTKFATPGNAGLWLVRDGKLTRLQRGHITDVSVSPDGCKLAFIYAASIDAQSSGRGAWRAGEIANTLQRMDLCRES
jgi:hypothetical protein